MGICLVRGRYFTAQDSASAAPVVIVDESLVRLLFPNDEALGKRISFEFHGAPGTNGQVVWREIVGIVTHVRHYGLASEPPFVQLYTPIDQLPIYFVQRRPSMALVARTTQAPETLTPAIRRAVAAIDPDIPVYNVQTMNTYIAQDTEQPRFGVMLLSGLGALALGSFLRTMLFEISPRDPATVTMIAGVLTAAGVLAAAVPARRATRVDPIVAMRG